MTTPLTSDLLPCGHCGAGLPPPPTGGVVQCTYCGASHSTYRHELRVLLCPGCGAPLNVQVHGGLVQCAYCRHSETLAGRNEVREYVEPAAEQMSEPQRLHHLAQQSRFALPVGFTAQALQPAWTESDAAAWHAWQGVRARIGAGGGASEQDALYALTRFLHRRCSRRNDHYRQRALVESALEVTTDPRYRQLLRCMLARNAARFGDLQAAREWLAPCNPRPLDIYMDSAFRLAHAAVETSAANFHRVLELLGPEAKEVPIAASFEDLTDLYRANAHEKMGATAQAVKQLTEGLEGFRRPKANAYVIGYMSEMVELYLLNQDIALAAVSFPIAYKGLFWSDVHDVAHWDPSRGEVVLRPPRKGWAIRCLVLFVLVVLPIVAVIGLGAWLAAGAAG